MLLRKIKICLTVSLLFIATFSFGQARIGISGTVEWDKMKMNALISLDLASAGLKLPAGRTQGEALITSEYLRLIRPNILNIQVDSSTVLSDLVGRGEWTLAEVEDLAIQARAVPPALSPDFSMLTASYSLDITGILKAHIHHQRPSDIPRTLIPVSAPAYTGIIIIASGTLPAHGMNTGAVVRPCLFPKIWDTGMNLIFEKNMLNPQTGAMARYFPMKDIFAGGPSGLSREIAAVVGNRPLRIFARGVFGVTPTDPIIGSEDALLIISSEENRSLLREGKVVIILEDAMLKNSLGE